MRMFHPLNLTSKTNAQAHRKVPPKVSEPKQEVFWSGEQDQSSIPWLGFLTYSTYKGQILRIRIGVTIVASKYGSGSDDLLLLYLFRVDSW